MANIKTVSGRVALRPRHAPYWDMISRGAYLGYRKTGKTGPGAWVARWREESGKQSLHSLGALADVVDSDRYSAAKQRAEEWFRHKGLGGSSEVKTVRDICADYVQHLRDEGREKAAMDAEGRLRRWIYSDAKLAGLPVLKLTKANIDSWRKRLRKTGAMPQDKTKESTRPRSEATLNRDMTCFRAALNLARVNGHVTTDEPWKVKLAAVKNADRRRRIYLTIDQRRKLLKHSAADVAMFLRALCLLPMRPGAVAALNAGDFDDHLSTVQVGVDKDGEPRVIKLPPETARFFAGCAKDKLPSAPLFMQADGRRWNKDAWKEPVKDAVRAAKLPPGTVAYSLRHSVITDLILQRVPTLTVAQMAGTSVQMIEAHYGHLLQEHAEAALAALAL